jgi:hypothetical protein
MASPFYQFLLTHKRRLFWIFFAGAFITAYVQIIQNKSLKNELAPNGIRSLQTEFNFTKDTAIVGSWNSVKVDKKDSENKTTITRADTAVNNILVDFFFIAFYTLWGIIVILWLQEDPLKKTEKSTGLLITLMIIAGVMDVVENLGILSVIAYKTGGGSNGFIHAIVIVKSLAAWIKFILLGALLLYVVVTIVFKKRGLAYLSSFFAKRKEALHRYRVIVSGIVVIVLAIWLSYQGQDLLVNVNATNWGVATFLGMLFMIASLNWYLAKLFFQTGKPAEVYPFIEPPGTLEERHISRFLGVATIIGPGAAILNTLSVTGLGYPFEIFPPEAWLMILLVIFYLLIKFDVADRVLQWLATRMNNNRKKAAGYLLLLAFFVAVVIPLAIRLIFGTSNHQPPLIYLYWHVILLAIAFYITVSVRREYFADNGFLGQKVGTLVFYMALTGSAVFLLLNSFPLIFSKLPTNYITLPALQAGVIFYIFLFTLLIRLSKKLETNFLLILILVAIAASLTGSDYHRVRRTAKPFDSSKDSVSPSLETYFRGWVLARKDSILANPDYPVFLVNTYGGGIRAAAFHSIAINWLDSFFLAEGKKSFEHYCFSVSGASGGTIGAAVQAAYYDKYREDTLKLNPHSFMEFYQRDFLSPVLVGDMGRDFLAGSFSVNWWSDRAYITDRTWSVIAKSRLQINLDDNYREIWKIKKNDSDYMVPLLFANTLNVDDGLKGICAPIPLSSNDFPATIFISALQDSLNAHVDPAERGEVSLITGAFLSARFPYISPSGKMGPGYHFMDGGGKDNSGANTSELIFAALGRYADSVRNQKPVPASDSTFTQCLQHLRFYFVSINNSAHSSEPRQLVDNRFEPASPIVGIVNSGIDGNARAADKTLLIRYGQNDSLTHLGFYTAYFNIYPTIDKITDPGSKDRYRPVLPLGWQISEPALRRLSASFSSEGLDKMGKKGVNSLLQKLHFKNLVQQ